MPWTCELARRPTKRSFRFGDGKADAGDGLVVVPAEHLRLMKGTSDEEYEVDVLKMADGAAHLVATRDGKSVSVPFNKTD